MDGFWRLTEKLGLTESNESLLRRLATQGQTSELERRLYEHPEQLPVALQVFAAVCNEGKAQHRAPQELGAMLHRLEDREERTDRAGRSALMPTREELVMQLIEAGSDDCLLEYLYQRSAQGRKALCSLIDTQAKRLFEGLNAGGERMWAAILGKVGKDGKLALRKALIKTQDFEALGHFARLGYARNELLKDACTERLLSAELLSAASQGVADDRRAQERLWQDVAKLTFEHAPEKIDIVIDACQGEHGLDALLSWWRESSPESWDLTDPGQRQFLISMARASGHLLGQRQGAEPPPWRLNALNALMRGCQQELVDCFVEASGQEAWAELWPAGGLGDYYSGPIATALIFDHIDRALPFAIANCPDELLDANFRYEESGLKVLDLIWRKADRATCTEAFKLLPEQILKDFWGPDENGRGPLHRGPCPSDEAILRLSQLCPTPQLKQLFGPDAYGRSPLFYWCAQPGKDLAASINACPESLRPTLWQADKHRQSPFHYAYAQEVKYPQLLPWDEIPQSAKALVFGADLSGHTLTHLACAGGFRLNTIKHYCPQELQEEQWIADIHGLNPVLLALAEPDKPRASFGGGMAPPEPAPDYLPEAPESIRTKLLQARDDRGFSALHLLMLRSPRKERIEEWTKLLGGKKALEARTHDGLRALDLHVMLGGDPRLIPLLHPNYESADKSLRDYIAAYRTNEYGDWELEQALYQRLAERHPLWAKGEQKLDEALELQKMIEGADYGSFYGHLLKHIYRMNQALPLSKEALTLFKSAYDKLPERRLEIQLMLQTSDNLDELRMALMSLEDAHSPDQDLRLMRAALMRERSAIDQVRQILKDPASPQRQQRIALRFLERCEIEISGKSLEQVYALMNSEELGADAIRAADAINGDPFSERHKRQLLKQLNSENAHAAIEALAHCHYRMDCDTDKEVLELALKLAEENQGTQLACSLAFLLSVLPSEESYRCAGRIVASKAWERFESGLEGQSQISTVGHFQLYPSRPRFDRSRARFQRMLAERYLELKRGSVQDLITERLEAYHQDPTGAHDLAMVERAIRNMKNNVRYLSFPLFYPKDRCFFRGVGCRNAEELRNAVLDEIKMAGSGSSDLTLYQDPNTGTWAKMRQYFFGSNLDFVLHGYFKEGALLITSSSDAINEAQMRLQLRYEKERGEINAIFYDRVLHYRISQLFLDKELQPHIEEHRELAATRKDAGRSAWKSLDRTARIGARRFNEAHGASTTSLSERVSYFDPKGSLGHQVRTRMQELGLKECSMNELVDENLERHIGHALLLEALEEADPLYRCVEQAASVPRPVYVVQHVSDVM